MPDYIPANDAEFDNFQATFITYASANAVALGLTPANITSLTTAQTPWTTSYPAHLAAKSAAVAATATKDANRETLESTIRSMARRVQSLPGTTDAQRAALGITIPGGGGPLGPPATRPEVAADTSQRLRITLSWRDETSPTGKAKPAGVLGAELYAKVGGEAPVDLDDCRFLALDTASPYTVEFEGEDANKTAYFIARWVNAKGEAGPISETVAATVPG